MKLKTIVKACAAALALGGAVQANAALLQGADPGPGTLVFWASDAATDRQYIFDTGLVFGWDTTQPFSRQLPNFNLTGASETSLRWGLGTGNFGQGAGGPGDPTNGGQFTWSGTPAIPPSTGGAVNALVTQHAAFMESANNMNGLPGCDWDNNTFCTAGNNTFGNAWSGNWALFQNATNSTRQGVNTNVSYLGVTAQTTPGPWTAVELGTMNFARVGDQYFVNFSPSVIPVPAALPLMLSGLIALGAIARRRTQAMAV